MLAIVIQSATDSPGGFLYGKMAGVLVVSFRI